MFRLTGLHVSTAPVVLGYYNGETGFTAPTEKKPPERASCEDEKDESSARKLLLECYQLR